MGNARWKMNGLAGAAAALLLTGGTADEAYAAEAAVPALQSEAGAQTGADTEAALKRKIVREANLALRALADRDFETLAGTASPTGIRFSPYAYVDTKTDRVLTPAQLKKAWNDRKAYAWGSYDGSGEPIALDFRGYYARFLNNLPYTAPDGVGYNRIVRSGNTASNLNQVYPESRFVEFYVKSGRSKAGASGGMDWGSLRFVFEKTNGVWKLSGIIGDRWTI